MPDSTIQQIKDRLDIVDVVSGYLKLEKTGINFRAPCPFHSEKKPSFFVSPTRQMFKCFGCSESGSIFDFIMKIEGIEFRDALKILARRAGVELPSYNPQLQTKRQRLLDLCDLASAFFEKQLQSSQVGKLVGEYLLKRGLQNETIKQWRLGYAPDEWRALSDFLVGRGYQRIEIIEAGLAVKSEKSQTPYDRFRGRIIFPVFDLNSQVIGFGGRVFDENPNKPSSQNEVIAKYLNIPNTTLYDKSRVLYGLNFGKMDVRKKDVCILTEGYMDVITSHQAGFVNTVAASGTALTSHQLQLIKRYTPNILTAFDMDAAGGMATHRGIDLAVAQDFNVKVICMPAEMDPADVISEDPKTWEKAINEATEIMEFRFKDALSKFDKSIPANKKEIATVLLPQIKKIPNQIVRSHWMQKLATVLNVSEQSILQEFEKIKEAPEPRNYNVREEVKNSPSNNFLQANNKTRRVLLAERMLSSLLQCPKAKELLSDDVLFACPANTAAILAAFKQGEENTLDEHSKIIFDSCIFQSEIEKPEKPEEEARLCSVFLIKLSLQNQLKKISEKIKMAEQNNDVQKLNVLMQQFNELAHQANV